MKKIFLTTIISTVLISNIFCQSLSPKNNFEKTFDNIYSGLKESVAWYDVPIAISFFGRNAVNGSNIGDKIVIHPSAFEIDFSEDNGKDGRYTAGSMDKDIIPDAIFYSRLGSAVLLNMFTDADISKDSYKNIFVFRKSLIYTYTFTEYVKSIVKRTRPNGKDNRSFFSGHTATTFAAATYLWKELDNLYDNWDVTKRNSSLKTVLEVSSFSILYGWAGFVGYSRIRDYKHYLSDVIVGAAVGTLISHFVYELYNDDEIKFLENINLIAMNNNSVGLSLNFRF